MSQLPRPIFRASSAIVLLALFLTGGSLFRAHGQTEIVIDRQIRIQPILVSNGLVTNNVDLKFFEQETDRIWAQAQVDIVFLPPVVFVSPLFFNVTSGAGSTALATLATTFPNGASDFPDVINMWFVNQINGSASVLGLTLQSTPGSGFTFVRNGIAIANSAFALNARTVLAHEIGHTLGLDHATFGASGQSNLMSQTIVPSGGIELGNIFPLGEGYGQLNAAQITQARSITQFVKPITPFVYKIGESKPRLSISRSGGAPLIALTGEIGKSYQLEFAFPLPAQESPWQNLALPELVLSNATQTILDSTFSGEARFYRARVVSP